MLINEAFALSCILDRLSPSTILDIGSGNRGDREIVQPHIYAAYRGHRVTWTDKSAGPGVVFCDICDKTSLLDLPWCEMVTCCSMLEHVEDIPTAIANLKTLTRKWLVVSVPNVYPEHHCPIDNLWRPSPGELAELFSEPDLVVVEQHLTEPETFYGFPDVRMSMVVLERKRR
jgi:hypothetical protein